MNSANFTFNTPDQEETDSLNAPKFNVERYSTLTAGQFMQDPHMLDLVEQGKSDEVETLAIEMGRGVRARARKLFDEGTYTAQQQIDATVGAAQVQHGLMVKAGEKDYKGAPDVIGMFGSVGLSAFEREMQEKYIPTILEHVKGKAIDERKMAEDSLDTREIASGSRGSDKFRSKAVSGEARDNVSGDTILAGDLFGRGFTQEEKFAKMDEVRADLTKLAKEKGTTYDQEFKALSDKVKGYVLGNSASLNEDSKPGDALFIVEPVDVAPGIQMVGRSISFKKPDGPEESNAIISYLRSADDFVKALPGDMSQEDYSHALLTYENGRASAISQAYDTLQNAEQEAFGGNDFNDYVAKNLAVMKKEDGDDFDLNKAQQEITVNFLEERVNDDGVWNWIDKVVVENVAGGAMKGVGAIAHTAASFGPDGNIVTQILGQGLEDANVRGGARTSMLQQANGKGVDTFLAQASEVVGQLLPTVAVGMASAGSLSALGVTGEAAIAARGAAAVKSTALTANMLAQGVVAGAQSYGANAVDFYSKLIIQAQGAGEELTDEKKAELRSKAGAMAAPGALATAAITFAGGRWMGTLEGQIARSVGAGSFAQKKVNLAKAISTYGSRTELIKAAKALTNNKATRKVLVDQIKMNNSGFRDLMVAAVKGKAKSAVSEGLEEGLAGGAESYFNAMELNNEGLGKSASLNDFLKGFADEAIMGAFVGGAIPTITGGAQEVWGAISKTTDAQLSVSSLIKANASIDDILKKGASMVGNAKALKTTKEGREMLKSIENTYQAANVKLAENMALPDAEKEALVKGEDSEFTQATDLSKPAVKAAAKTAKAQPSSEIKPASKNEGEVVNLTPEKSSTSAEPTESKPSTPLQNAGVSPKESAIKITTSKDGKRSSRSFASEADAKAHIDSRDSNTTIQSISPIRNEKINREVTDSAIASLKGEDTTPSTKEAPMSGTKEIAKRSDPKNQALDDFNKINVSKIATKEDFQGKALYPINGRMEEITLTGKSHTFGGKTRHTAIRSSFPDDMPAIMVKEVDLRFKEAGDSPGEVDSPLTSKEDAPKIDSVFINKSASDVGVIKTKGNGRKEHIESFLENTILSKQSLIDSDTEIEIIDSSVNPELSSTSSMSARMTITPEGKTKIVVGYDGKNQAFDPETRADLFQKALTEEVFHVATFMSFSQEGEGTATEKHNRAVAEITTLGESILSDPDKLAYLDEGYHGFDIDPDTQKASTFTDPYQAGMEYLHLVGMRAKNGENVRDLFNSLDLTGTKADGVIATIKRWIAAAKRVLEASGLIASDPDMQARLDGINAILDQSKEWEALIEKSKEGLVSLKVREDAALEAFDKDIKTKEQERKSRVDRNKDLPFTPDTELSPSAAAIRDDSNDVKVERLQDWFAFLSASRVLGKGRAPIERVGSEWKLALAETAFPETANEAASLYSVYKAVPPTHAEALALVKWINSDEGKFHLSEVGSRPDADGGATINEFIAATANPLDHVKKSRDKAMKAISAADISEDHINRWTDHLDAMERAILFNNLTSQTITYGDINPKEGFLGMDNEVAMRNADLFPEVNWGIVKHSETHVATRMIAHYLNPDANIHKVTQGLINQRPNNKVVGNASVPLGGEFTNLMKMLTNKVKLDQVKNDIPAQSKAIQALADSAVEIYGVDSDTSGDNSSTDLPQAILLMADKIVSTDNGWVLSTPPLNAIHVNEDGSIDWGSLGKELSFIVGNIGNMEALKEHKSFSAGEISYSDYKSLSLPSLKTDMKDLVGKGFESFLKKSGVEYASNLRITNTPISFTNRPDLRVGDMGVLFDAISQYAIALDSLKTIPSDHPIKEWLGQAAKAAKAGRSSLKSDQQIRNAINNIQGPLELASKLEVSLRKNLGDIYMNSIFGDKVSSSQINEILDAGILDHFEKGTLEGTSKASGFSYAVARDTMKLLRSVSNLKETDFDSFVQQIEGLLVFDSRGDKSLSIADIASGRAALNDETGTDVSPALDILKARDIAEKGILKMMKNKSMDKEKRTFLILQAVGGDVTEARRLVTKHLNNENADSKGIDFEISKLLVDKIRSERIAGAYSQPDLARRFLLSATVRPYVSSAGAKNYASMAATFSVSDDYLNTFSGEGSIEENKAAVLESINKDLAIVEENLAKLGDELAISREADNEDNGGFESDYTVNLHKNVFKEEETRKVIEFNQKFFSKYSGVDKRRLSIGGLAPDQYKKFAKVLAESPSTTFTKSDSLQLAESLSAAFVGVEGSDSLIEKHPLIGRFLDEHKDVPVISYDGSAMWGSDVEGKGQGLIMDDNGGVVGIILDSSNSELSQKLLANEIITFQIQSGTINNPAVDDIVAGVRSALSSLEKDIVSRTDITLAKNNKFLGEVDQGFVGDEVGFVSGEGIQGLGKTKGDKVNESISRNVVRGKGDATLAQKKKETGATTSPRSVSKPVSLGSAVLSDTKSEFTQDVVRSGNEAAIVHSGGSVSPKSNLGRLLNDLGVTSIGLASNTDIIVAMMGNPNMHRMLAQIPDADLKAISDLVDSDNVDPDKYATYMSAFDSIAGAVEFGVNKEVFYEESVSAEIERDSADPTDDEVTTEADRSELKAMHSSNPEYAENVFGKLIFELMESSVTPKNKNNSIAKVMDVSGRMETLDKINRKRWSEMQALKDELDAKNRSGKTIKVRFDQYLSDKRIGIPRELQNQLKTRRHFGKVFNILDRNMSEAERENAVSYMSEVKGVATKDRMVRAGKSGVVSYMGSVQDSLVKGRFGEAYSMIYHAFRNNPEWFSADADLGSAEFSILAVALESAEVAHNALNKRDRKGADGSSVTESEYLAERIAIAETKQESLRDQLKLRREEAHKAKPAAGIIFAARRAKGNSPASPAKINPEVIAQASKIAGRPVSGAAVAIGSAISNRAKSFKEGASKLVTLLQSVETSKTFDIHSIGDNLDALNSLSDSLSSGDTPAANIMQNVKGILAVTSAWSRLPALKGKPTDVFDTVQDTANKIATSVRALVEKSMIADEFGSVDTSGLVAKIKSMEDSLALLTTPNLIAHAANKLGDVGAGLSYESIKNTPIDDVLDHIEARFSELTGADFNLDTLEKVKGASVTSENATDQSNLYQDHVKLEKEITFDEARLASLNAVKNSYLQTKTAKSLSELHDNSLVGEALSDMMGNWIDRISNLDRISQGNPDFNRKRANSKDYLSSAFLGTTSPDSDTFTSRFIEGGSLESRLKAEPFNMTNDDLSKANDFMTGLDNPFSEVAMAKDVAEAEVDSHVGEDISEEGASPDMHPDVIPAAESNAPAVAPSPIGQVLSPPKSADAIASFVGDVKSFVDNGSILPSLGFKMGASAKALSDNAFKVAVSANTILDEAYKSATSKNGSIASASIVSQAQAMVNDLAMVAVASNMDASMIALASRGLRAFADGNLSETQARYHEVVAFMIKNDFNNVIAKSGKKGKAAAKLLKVAMLHHDAMIATKYASSSKARAMALHWMRVIDAGVDGKSGTNGAENMADTYVARIQKAAKPLNKTQIQEATIVSGLLAYSPDSELSPSQQFERNIGLYESSLVKMGEASNMDVSSQYKKTVKGQMAVIKSAIAKARTVADKYSAETVTSSFFELVENDILSSLSVDQNKFISESRSVFAELKPSVKMSMALQGREIGNIVNYTPITSYTDQQMKDGSFDSVLTRLPEGSYARTRFQGLEETAMNINGDNTFASSIKTMTYGLNTKATYSMIGNVFGSPDSDNQVGDKPSIPLIIGVNSQNNTVDGAIKDSADFIAGLTKLRYDNDHPEVRHAGGWEKAILSTMETGLQHGLLSKWQFVTQTVSPVLTYLTKSNPKKSALFMKNLALHGEERRRLNKMMMELEPSIAKRGFDGGDANAVERMWKDYKDYGGVKKIMTGLGVPFSVAKSMGSWALNNIIGKPDGWMIKAMMGAEYEHRTGRVLHNETSTTIDHGAFALARARAESSLAQSKGGAKANFLQGNDNAALNIVSKMASSYSNHMVSVVAGSRAGLSIMRRADTKADFMEGLGMFTEVILQNAYFMLSKPAGLAVLYGVVKSLSGEDDEKAQQRALDAFSTFLLDPERKAKSAKDYWTHFGVNQAVGATGTVAPWTALTFPNGIISDLAKWGAQSTTGVKLVHDGFTNDALKDKVNMLGAAGTAINNYIDVAETYMLNKKEINFGWKDAAYLMSLAVGEREWRARLKQDLNKKHDVITSQKELDKRSGKVSKSNPKKKDDKTPSFDGNTSTPSPGAQAELDQIKSNPFINSLIDGAGRGLPKGKKHFNPAKAKPILPPDNQKGDELTEVNLQSKDFSVIDGSEIMPHRHNDGDSFHIKKDGNSVEFRLHHVDTTESKSSRYNGDRLKKQGAYFGGISKDDTVALGKIAAAYTRDLLSKNDFKVVTKYGDVYGPGRKYAYIVLNQDGKDVFLHELLVSKGLVRVNYPVDSIRKGGSRVKVSDGDMMKANLPDGASYRSHYSKLRRMEAKAKKDGLGGWGMNNSYSVPAKF